MIRSAMSVLINNNNLFVGTERCASHRFHSLTGVQTEAYKSCTSIYTLFVSCPFLLHTGLEPVSHQAHGGDSHSALIRSQSPRMSTIISSPSQNLDVKGKVQQDPPIGKYIIHFGSFDPFFFF